MKSFLTLLITVAVVTVINAQTTAPQEPVVPANPEAPKKVAYEIVPAKRVVTPTTPPPADMQPVDITEIEKKQKDAQVQKKIEQRNTSNGTPQQAPQKKEPVYDLKDEQPKE